MSVAELVRKITRRAEEKQTATVSSYRQLVRSLAGDRAVDDDQAADILEAAGKSAGDLQADVAAAQERDRMRLAVVELPALQAKHRDVECTRTKADATIESAREAYAAVVQETREQSASLQARITGLEEYQRKLWVACDDPALRSRDRELIVELQRLREREISLDEDGKTSHIGGTTWRADFIRAQARVKELRAALAGVRGENSLIRPFNRSTEERMEKELADLEQTIVAFEVQKIAPARLEREQIAKRRAEINAEQIALVSQMQAS